MRKYIQAIFTLVLDQKKTGPCLLVKCFTNLIYIYIYYIYTIYILQKEFLNYFLGVQLESEKLRLSLHELGFMTVLIYPCILAHGNIVWWKEISRQL